MSKPRSPRQIEASRINGARSRGPITPEGRANSAGHNLRHGMLASTVVLPDESAERFHSLIAALEARFRPRDAVEFNLIEVMAVARWRLMRLWGMEKATLAHEIHKQTEGSDPPEIDRATRAGLAFRSLGGNANPLDLMTRYELRCDRQYDRALDRLTRLQAKREKQKSNSVDLIPTSD